MRLRATILQTPTPGALEVLEDRVVTVDDRGRISAVEPAAGHRSDPTDVVFPATTVLIPGLVDTHVHAPQWPQLGTGLDLPLEEWLLAHTFPLEARYADEGFARRVWADLVPTLLANGTTTAVYYGSIHEPATVALADACLAAGQRALVGRVAMDHPDTTPDGYRDAGAAAGVEASARSVEAVRALAGPDGLVQPIVTPRFIPACTDALLSGLGELAAATATRIQTHCSESDWEHQHVADRCGRSDAQALDGFGLLAPHGVLAHATHLAPEDRGLLIDRGAGVSHCPLSNVFFSERIFPVAESLAAGVSVGLGTDIAGGPDPSLLAQCGHAVGSSRELGRRPAAQPAPGVEPRIDITTAFHLATAGGADLLGLPVGLLRPGRWFDAVAVDLGPEGIGIWDEVDDWARAFEKLVRRARPADLSDVWVAGRRVAGREGAALASPS